MATGTRVSKLAVLFRASIITGPRGLPVCLGSLYTNQSISCSPANISFKALQDRRSPLHLCFLFYILRWLSLAKDWESYSFFLRPISQKPVNLGSVSHLLVSTINLSCPSILATGQNVRQVSLSPGFVVFAPEDITLNMFWSSSWFLFKSCGPSQQFGLDPTFILFCSWHCVSPYYHHQQIKCYPHGCRVSTFLFRSYT